MCHEVFFVVLNNTDFVGGTICCSYILYATEICF